MSAPAQVAEVLNAFTEATRAGARFQATFNDVFAVDTAVKWERGGGIHEGVVVRHGYKSRLQVRNERTDATYWVTMSDVMRGYGWRNPAGAA